MLLLGLHAKGRQAVTMSDVLIQREAGDRQRPAWLQRLVPQPMRLTGLAIISARPNKCGRRPAHCRAVDLFLLLAFVHVVFSVSADPRKGDQRSMHARQARRSGARHPSPDSTRRRFASSSAPGRIHDCGVVKSMYRREGGVVASRAAVQMAEPAARTSGKVRHMQRPSAGSERFVGAAAPKSIEATGPSLSTPEEGAQKSASSGQRSGEFQSLAGGVSGSGQAIRATLSAHPSCCKHTFARVWQPLARNQNWPKP
jgi:hypothetical protein